MVAALPVIPLMTLEALLATPETTLEAPLTTDEAEAPAPERAPPAAEVTEAALEEAPLAMLVMARELEREEMTPPSMELEAEGAEMVDERDPETD